jgi:excisionase family DNA binding protein
LRQRSKYVKHLLQRRSHVAKGMGPEDEILLVGATNTGLGENPLQCESGEPIASAYGRYLMPTETLNPSPSSQAPVERQRLAYSLHEAADLLGVDYFSVYRLIQRGKLRACRALRGKLLVPRTELLRLLKG